MADETENKSWWEQIIENKNGNTSDSAGISAAQTAAEAAQTAAESAQAAAEAAQETADEALTAASTVASTSSLGVVKLSSSASYVVANSTTDNTASGGVGMTSNNELVARCATTNGNYGTVKLSYTGSTVEGGSVGRNSSGALSIPVASASEYGVVKTASEVSDTSDSVPTNAAVYAALGEKADVSEISNYVDLTSDQLIAGAKKFTGTLRSLDSFLADGTVSLGISTSIGEIITAAGGDGTSSYNGSLAIYSAITSYNTNTFSGTNTFTGEVHIQDAVSDDSPVTYSQLQALVDRVAALEAAAESE